MEVQMTEIDSGLIAGFLATIVLSMMMLMKRQMGIMPELSMIGMLGRVTDQPRSVDWLIHFIVGTVFYGLLIAFLAPMLPFDYWLDGVIVGLIGWMIASLTLMPAAGRGFFGLNIGASAFIMSMMMHVIFGAILGLIYDWLVG